MDLPAGRSYSDNGWFEVMKCAIENSTYALPFSFIFQSALLQYLAHSKSLLSKYKLNISTRASSEGLI